MSRARVPAGAPLCAAVRELLCEVGYDKMTMDAIASRAHMSKATLYRHWPGKPDLVAQVLRQQQADDVAPADTGSLRGDLIELLAAAARCVVEEGPLIHALSFAMRTDPELAGIVRGQVYPAIHRYTEALLERAVQRGEIKPQPFDSLFPDLVTAQLMARHLGHGRPLDDEYLARVCDEVLLPVLAR